MDHERGESIKRSENYLGKKLVTGDTQTSQLSRCHHETHGATVRLTV